MTMVLRSGQIAVVFASPDFIMAFVGTLAISAFLAAFVGVMLLLRRKQRLPFGEIKFVFTVLVVYLIIVIIVETLNIYHPMQKEVLIDTYMVRIPVISLSLTCLAKICRILR